MRIKKEIYFLNQKNYHKRQTTNHSKKSNCFRKTKKEKTKRKLTDANWKNVCIPLSDNLKYSPLSR